MSAADRMVVRTRDGYRSVARRVGLGLIAAGRAHAQQAPAQDVEAPTVPATPEPAHTAPQRVQTTPDGLTTLDVYVDGPIEGVRVGLMGRPDEEVPTIEAVELPPEPRGNASRPVWAEYAESLGVEVTSDMTRNEIRDAAQDAAQSLDRLPQPARTGGRLDTPEDEPVTDGSVTDDEDPGTR